MNTRVRSTVYRHLMSYTINIVTFILVRNVTRPGHLSRLRTRPPKITVVDICHRTYPNTNQGVGVRDNCFRERGRCRGTKCQITRGVSAYVYAETALIGLHLPRAATAEREVRHTVRGSVLVRYNFADIKYFLPDTIRDALAWKKNMTSSRNRKYITYRSAATTQLNSTSMYGRRC